MPASEPYNYRMQIYIDGNFYSKEAAKISVFDHGLLYGDGVFEGIRAYEGLVFCLDEHLARLYDSAATIELEIPLSRSEFADVIVETLRRNRITSGYIRPVVTRGFGNLGLDPRACPKATVIVIADKLTLYPPKFYEEGLEVAIINTRRNLATAIPPRIKSLNYINNVLGRLEVNRLGVGEGIMLNVDGNIGEATADNVFVVKNRALRTPKIDHSALPGITRARVMELAAEAGVPSEEATVTPADLYAADECFLTGTGAEIVPVRSIRGSNGSESAILGTGRPGPITLQLTERFKALTKTRGRRYTID